MPEEPLGGATEGSGAGTRAAPVRVYPRGQREGTDFPLGFRQERPRVVVKADLLPAVSAVSLVAMVGVPLGWLWSRLAPPTHSRLYPNGELLPASVESYHEFDGLAIFLLFGFGAGLLTGALLWLMRRRRGPVMLLAAVLGSLVAAWLAAKMGTSLAVGLYPAAPAAKPGALVAVAPRVGTMWAMVAQPLGAALAYGFAASWNGMDDLGRRLS